MVLTVLYRSTATDGRRHYKLRNSRKKAATPHPCRSFGREPKLATGFLRGWQSWLQHPYRFVRFGPNKTVPSASAVRTWKNSFVLPETGH